ncbi:MULTISPECIES: hypothetical protein [Paenibacillus]|uniref:Cell division protein FtsL n=1 Tax=Paenibacillus azoreducens TaxID=116718 RepID=A0A919YJ99_9BACL|nr:MULTISPECIES: hypothetical protein [Paenibacillus]MBE9912765.1 hypothetical protein [Paenibacillus donghaensis]GIO49680.1 hypothetical protein J34TS1_44450 [Paenibacillus azoreducens]
MAYTRGNLAVKEQTQTKRTSPGYREKTMVVTRRTSLPTKEKLLYLLTVIVCVMVASLIIWQNANIYGLNKEYQQAERAIKSAKAEINKLVVLKQQLEVGIRNEAKKLGYQEPIDQPVINVERTPIASGTVNSDVKGNAKK